VALKQALTYNPHDFTAHFHLAAAYSELGREKEARAEAAGILRISPNFSLEVFSRTTPQKDPAIAERTLEALRKAGLK